MQTEIVNLNDLVKRDHPYRKLLSIIDFVGLTKNISHIKNNQVAGRAGYNVDACLKMLVLQFMEDLSDRELERFIAENTAAKLFCDFSLISKTPDHSLFGRLRKSISTTALASIFNSVREQLKQKGLVREIFTFVDSSQLVSKIHLWNERDKAIAEGLEKFNNCVIEENKSKNINNNKRIKIADEQARFGCKGKNKHWYGYKRHLSVDMQSGLINKAAVTPANVSDAKAVKHILPKQGAVFGDKGYCTADSTIHMKIKNLHNCTIKTNNMKDKNFDKDKWISKARSPYERVFSKVSNRSRYRGIAKNQFQVFMESLAFNFKRLIKLEDQKLSFST
jgi:transposase, IS5 family